MPLFPAATPTEPWRPGMYDAAIKADLARLPDRHALPLASPPPIRATQKAAEWGAAIHRAYGHLAGRIRGPSRQVELAALYEQTIAEGPDFAKVRRNATFTPCEVVAYTPQAAAEIMRQAREIERETYASRPKGAHGGGLGRMALQLLEWFTYVMWPKARFGMTPSLGHIAAGARMSKQTVVKAMMRLERFGFLTIQRRRKRVPTAFGARLVQDTNAYLLGVAKSLGALAMVVFRKKPPGMTDKPSGFSESIKPPAIRIDHYSSMPNAENWLGKPDYEPLLE